MKLLEDAGGYVCSAGNGPATHTKGNEPCDSAFSQDQKNCACSVGMAHWMSVDL